MSELAFGFMVFACVFAGAMAGLWLSPLLPHSHRSDATRDAVRLGAGMISILASLVLGLLTASAKGKFDNTDQQLRSYAADLIQLDQVLRDYGSAADPIRARLLRYTEVAVHTTWPTQGSPQPEPLESTSEGEMIDRVPQDILQLDASDDRQRWMREHALDLASELIHTRWSVLVGQEGTFSPVLLGIMVAWITFIFASFGLNAPRNATVVVAFVLCSASIGASVFLIDEMDTPFTGVIMVSPAPMQDALAHLRQ